MERKNTFFIFVIIVMIAAVLVQPIYAWFVMYQTRILIVTGDIHMDVMGWYQVATVDDELSENGGLTYDNPLVNINTLSDVFIDHFIAFKFRIINKSGQNGKLSIRFNDFSENIFRYFREYYTLIHGGDPAVPDEEEALLTKIKAASEENTAKTVLTISDVYYTTSEGGNRHYISENGGYLWKYLVGQKFVESIDLPNALEGEKPVYVYFKLTNNQTLESLTEYREWLCGYEEEDEDGEIVTRIGYGQERCANLLGYTWEGGLSAEDKEFIDYYLRMFYEYEISSINVLEEDMSRINLNIRYFEFIGETTPL